MAFTAPTMEVEVQVEEVESKKCEVKKGLLSKNKLAIIVNLPSGETQFCCVQCPVRSNVKEELEVHLLTHITEYRHLCPVCGTGLKRKEHMERHMFEHGQVRAYVCEVCSKGFKRKEHLNIHRSIHSGDRTEICVLCHKKFYRKDHLQKHLQTHGKHLAEQGIYLMSEHELMDIKTEVDPEGSEGSQGEIMDSEEYGAEEQDMTEPAESTMCTEGEAPEGRAPAGDRPFACHLCDKTYKRKDHLKLHIQTHTKKDKICTECGKAFHRQDQLLAHMGTHINSYAQNNGDNSYVDESDSLLVPMESERRHGCEVCGRRFKRRQHLRVHYNVHAKQHAAPPAPPAFCATCGQGFYSTSELERHSCMSVTADSNSDQPQQDAKKENEYPLQIIPLEEPKPEPCESITDESRLPFPRVVFVCKYCGKPFKRKDHYKIHLHIHTGVKTFFCPQCGKGFYRKDHLQKHVQVHSKPKVNLKRALPGLFPIQLLKKHVKPEITIHAPSNVKLRVPLQIKVPYQMVVAKTEDPTPTTPT